MIQLEGVSKMYRLYDRPADRLRELATLGRGHFHREHWALRDISVEIRKGETFCVVGENGSGKSTLLQLISGILQPTSGTIRTNGRLTALLELGAGFNPEFTGRNNLFLNGAILGLSKREVQQSLDDILNFAELGPYIDQPVKTYSSGMVVRLGFALAVHLHPEILVVDEALAVGDVYFRHRCMRKIHELRARGVTIVYVTHDIADIKAIGHRAMWLQNGSVRLLGNVADVAQQYLAALLNKDAGYRERQSVPAVGAAPTVQAPEIVKGLPAGITRWGDGAAEVAGAELVNPAGEPVSEITTPAQVVVRLSLRACRRIEKPIAGILLRTAEGIDFSGSNTARQNIPVEPLNPGEIRTFDFWLRLPEMAPGHYTFGLGVADGDLIDYRMCDMAEKALPLRILPGPRPVHGMLQFPCSVEIHQIRA